MSKLYFGGPDERPSVGVGRKKKPLPVPKDKDGNPLSFDWGDGMPGSTRLAFAILHDALGDKTLALKFHQRFKLRQVATWTKAQPWAITQRDVLAQIEDMKKIELEHGSRIRRMVDSEPRPVVSEVGGGIGRSEQDWERRS